MRKRLLFRAAGWLVAGLARLWIRTLRVHKEDINPDSQPFRKGNQGRIYCFWHEDMLTLANLFSEASTPVLISTSREGGLLKALLDSLGFQTACDSSQQGESLAKQGMEVGQEGSSLGYSSDCPTGPRREFQAGAITLASRTGRPLVPIGLAYDRPWHVLGRNKLVIPRPFSRVVVCANGPHFVPAGANRESLEAQRLKVAALMQESSLRAESLLRRWRKGEKLPLVSPEAKAAEVAPLRKSA